MKKIISLIVLFASTFSYSQIDYDLSGYVVNLPVLQKANDKLHSLFGFDKNIILDISRLRLRSEIYFSDRFWLNLEYEANALYYDAPLQFDLLQQTQTNRQLLDLSWKIADGKNFTSNQYIDRAFIRYSMDIGNITIGRQRISWGSGRIWNPTDLFNPINPVNFAKTEKDGADAVSFNYFIANFTDIELVLNPTEKMRNNNFGFRFRTNYNEFDLSFIGGRFDNTVKIGLDLAGNLFDSGIRWEGIYSLKSDHAEEYLKYIIGIDYQFTPELYALMEFHHNGEGKSQKLYYQIQRLIRGEIINLSRNYLYAGLSYLISPLLTAMISNISNLNDKSGLFAFTADYSISEDFYANFGFQLPYGSIFTEFWYYPQSYYLQLNCYF
ncbi:MAG: hypothetical protein JW995_09700 [Melioribacteraceae bacterium]|nr:hypothetical protein [Melioribacteraceae bacterium]